MTIYVSLEAFQMIIFAFCDILSESFGLLENIYICNVCFLNLLVGLSMLYLTAWFFDELRNPLRLKY